MKVLVVGGTGVIGTGIVKHLLARGASVTVFSRGHRREPDGTPVEGLAHVTGDRWDRDAFENAMGSAHHDAVIDMMCFSPEDAESSVRVFGGRCEHFVFCSTVCTYSVHSPPSVLVDETFEQRPPTPYGKSKLGCEAAFLRAADAKRFAVTIVRPSHTYGPGGPMLDQLEIDGVAWDRTKRGMPVLCAGDGLGLWQSTHRDDVGRFFAHAALNPKTYGESYNVTREDVLTWRAYHREVATAMDAAARLVFAPAAWLLRRLPERFAFLRDVTRFHGAYSSAKARAHVPEFTANVTLREGARETLASLAARGAWRDSADDAEYQRVVDEALAAGFELADA